MKTAMDAQRKIQERALKNMDWIETKIDELIKLETEAVTNFLDYIKMKKAKLQSAQ